MTGWQTVMTDMIRILKRNGLAGGLVALAILAAGPVTAGAHGFAAPLAWWLLLGLCVAALTLSIHLLFDAALFRLALSFETEQAGLAAIDDTLMRMGLRRGNGDPAPLRRRRAGCQRLFWRQRIALALSLALYVILLIDSSNGGYA